MTGVNVDYTLMGGQWDNTRPITYSIAPDGVAWDTGTNEINSAFNAEFGGTSWQRDVATALQTWAASANLNFVQVPDGPYAFNTQGQSQGDTRFGDIRVAGFNLNAIPVAQTYGPPPNGWTAGGDVKVNTSYTYGPGGQYDLESVLIHETGHSLGLGESPQPGSDMYIYYSGVRHDLSPFDVEGIQSIYGPRQQDSYQARGQGVSATTAIDLTSSFSSANLAIVDGLSLASIGSSEYFAATAPQIRGAALQINAVAFGHSLMSPKLSVIDAATGATLAVAAHPDQYGDVATVTVPGVIPGHKYLIVVTGATQDVFSVGNYSLQAAFVGGTGLTSTVGNGPVVPVSSVTALPAGTTTPVATVSMGGAIAAPVPDSYSVNTTFASAAELGAISGQAMIRNVSLRSGQDTRVFAIEPAQVGQVNVASANTMVTIFDSNSHMVAMGRGLVGFSNPQAGTRYFVVLTSPNNAAVSDASFALQVLPSAFAAPTPATPVVTPVAVGHRAAVAASTSASHKKLKRRRHH